MEDMRGNNGPDEPTPEGIAAVVAAGLFAMMAPVVEVLHDWADGERQHFLRQGFTPEEARAMAAATYTTVFGIQINKGGGNGT